MKYVKILINITVWHLIPYHLRERSISGHRITELGWLCIKLVITWSYEPRFTITKKK